MRTTPPPTVDMLALFPELAGKGATTVRLHPRQGAEPAATSSKLGGRFLWPVDEPWPRCDSSLCGIHDSLVPVLQLRREDFPEMPFPDDTNLFQLLWCPHDPSGVGPYCRAWWRHDAHLVERDVLPSSNADPDLVPSPCQIDPERVQEWPSIFSLPVEFCERIEAWERAEHAGEPVYQYLNSVAEGTKVGGHVGWIQEPAVPSCSAGHLMEHLLTVASAEFDGGSWPRWCPVVDQHVWTKEYSLRNAVQRAAKLMLGDMGSVYVFVCPRCPHFPIHAIHQCS